MKGALVLTVLFCLLAACAPRRVAAPTAASFGRYSFSYEIENQTALGIIQVFDDGQKTYLKCLPGTPIDFEIKGKEKRPLTVKQEGGFLTVYGIHERLTIKDKEKKEATIRRIHEISPLPLYAPKKRDDTL